MVINLGVKLKKNAMGEGNQNTAKSHCHKRMTRLTNNPLKVFIHRNSVCIRLKLEFDYEGLFKKNPPYKITNKVCDADLILYETCAVTHWSEDRCVSEIKKLNKKRKKNSKFIVCGCMVKINRSKLKRLFKNDIILIETFSDFKKILSKGIDYSNVKAKNVFIDNSFMNQKSNNKLLSLISNIKISRFHIPDYVNFIYKVIAKNVKIRPNEPGFHILISKGCLNNCSYCAIKIAKNIFGSKSPDRIIEEFEEGLSKGHKKVFLHAEDLGSYGKDIGTSLIELLNKFIAYKQDFKINLIGLNMKWLIKDYSEYCKIFDTGKIHRLCVPLQSGNNRILKLMNREYDIKTTKKILKEINKNYPNISLQTHIMVGFPTETISEFKDSIGLINEINFDYIQATKFSPRLRTKAYRISPKISEKEMDRRYKHLKRSFRNQKLKKILNYKSYLHQ